LERGLHRAPHRDTLQRLAAALSLEAGDQAALLAATRRPVPRQQPIPATPSSALPLAITSLVGREREISEVKRLVATTRLLTLTGAGGVGKTRLALEAAAHLTADFPDGKYVVELAALREPTLVPQALAQAVGVREQSGSPLLSTLTNALMRRRGLILLDNCEHLLAASAALVAHVLRACPGVRFLVTSRAPLGVPGEVNWRVPSLSFPDRDGHAPTVEEALGCDAVRLFSERASTARPGWAVNQANAADVVHICRRLDGIPLAIELAAAWVRMLSAREISERLDDRFRLLVGGSVMQPERHRTLAAAVSWSYDLLLPEEQRLFERLAVFSGGFGLSAVGAVCSDATGHGSMLDLVSRLVDRSLVLAEPRDGELETRYRLLETLRAYAWERLQARGETALVRDRHAAWLTGLAEEAERSWHGPQEGRWLRWAEREHGNVRGVLQWALEREDAGTALRLGAALWYAWTLHLRWSEGRAWLERVLELVGARTATGGRASVLTGAGMLASFLGDLPTAQAYLGQSLALGSEVGDEFIVLRVRVAAAV
ncbi:MAG TPA: AAA family ATPase, partial [Burkholderiaceae bacterium]